jgi:hypothetical protein
MVHRGTITPAVVSDQGYPLFTEQETRRVEQEYKQVANGMKEKRTG